MGAPVYKQILNHECDVINRNALRLIDEQRWNSEKRKQAGQLKPQNDASTCGEKADKVEAQILPMMCLVHSSSPDT